MRTGGDLFCKMIARKGVRGMLSEDVSASVRMRNFGGVSRDCAANTARGEEEISLRSEDYIFPSLRS